MFGMSHGRGAVDRRPGEEYSPVWGGWLERTQGRVQEGLSAAQACTARLRFPSEEKVFISKVLELTDVGGRR